MQNVPVIINVQHVQITIPTGAEKAAREFYCEFLGMLEIPKPKSLRDRSGFWLEIGSFQVHVGLEDNLNRNNSKAHVAYEVKNLSAWKVKLKTRGIENKEGLKIPFFERFEFRDPFGNRVEFLEKSAI